ncbi:polysaccharide deacetylase family protein [Rhodocytophaga aerolata]|uniref:Polysaccharide deacetylase family protein n=1 Tax=Rhodocytophaga aerolata TaxID=455078 RepID=A0ABT8R6Z9_9BACT|nr:polysaccharide deacetylase family protein [Rhodocytophaga aerolata]MDO1446532.1 polysaccharide deacetylase family protein [Rhodocytophaga aerolata]
MRLFFTFITLSFLLLSTKGIHAQALPPLAWPQGKRMALSLTFDDARMSQVEKGTALLNEYKAKATFYVVPATVKQRLESWKQAVVSGHEIGNHSLNHPCTGNFPWARQKALEDYTLDNMRNELREANQQIKDLLGVTPQVFAYPCGQTFVGRGKDTKSYVPVIAELFSSGRLWLSEGPNDPLFCDMAQLTGMEMDGKNFDQIKPLLEKAKETGQWVVLAGHEMNDSGEQTTRLSMLKDLLAYAQDPANGIWLAPVGTVSEYIQKQKKPAKP